MKWITKEFNIDVLKNLKLNKDDTVCDHALANPYVYITFWNDEKTTHSLLCKQCHDDNPKTLNHKLVYCYRCGRKLFRMKSPWTPFIYNHCLCLKCTSHKPTESPLIQSFHDDNHALNDFNITWDGNNGIVEFTFTEFIQMVYQHRHWSSRTWALMNRHKTADFITNGFPSTEKALLKINPQRSWLSNAVYQKRTVLHNEPNSQFSLYKVITDDPEYKINYKLKRITGPISKDDMIHAIQVDDIKRFCTMNKDVTSEYWPDVSIPSPDGYDLSTYVHIAMVPSLNKETRDELRNRGMY